MTAPIPIPYTPGPFDSTHIYVQWGGKLPGNEQWSCGFRMWSAGGSDQADAEDMFVPVAAAISAFHTSPNTAISGNAKLSYCKVNAINVEGRYQQQSTLEATFADLPGGMSAAVGIANQIALVCTLETGFSRGPAHRGRFYLPIPYINVDPATGRINPAMAAQVRDSCNEMRTAVNAALAGHQMVVMSRKAGAPGHRAVTGFKVGTVLDTQRRRRGSLVENYQ